MHDYYINITVTNDTYRFVASLFIVIYGRKHFIVEATGLKFKTGPLNFRTLHLKLGMDILAKKTFENTPRPLQSV